MWSVVLADLWSLVTVVWSIVSVAEELSFVFEWTRTFEMPKIFYNIFWHDRKDILATFFAVLGNFGKE